MKHVVVDTGMHETEIRPPDLLSEFKRLTLQEAQRFFGDASTLVDVPNPATGGGDSTFAFEKDGFRYNVADECGSLFVSPRPTKEALAEYYRESEASAYRVRQYARETAEARRSHLFASHIGWMGRLYDEYGNRGARTFVDIGTNSLAVFDEVRRLDMFDRLCTFNPMPGLEEEFAASGVEVLGAPITGAGAVTAFHQLENQFSPYDLVASARSMLAENGLVCMTTRTISGFDSQILWDKAPYIFVPEHLNLLSIEGIELLVARAGLETIELSTPGQLDIELVAHAVAAEPDIELPRFVQYLLQERGPLAHEDFQDFLQKHRLSSHARVAAQRREEVT